MTGAPRVLVVYQHLPHYRNGVFLELQRDATVEYEFAADTRSRDGSIPTIPTAPLRRFHRLINHWYGPALWQAGLVRLVTRTRYQAVIFLGDAAYLSTWVAAALCRATGVQVLYWTTGWHRPDRGLRRQIRQTFYRIAHVLMLYGDVGRKFGVAVGFPAERMTVIGNSHSSHLSELEQSSPAELAELAQLLPEPGSEVATAVIRLNPEKRLDLLIRAAGQLRDRGRPITVMLVGDGPERGRLRDLATELGVDLRLVGPIYANDKLALIYQRTTVTVVPVYAGLTSIQSLTHGRPVITSDNECNQAPESECVRPGITGGLYRDGSVDSLATTIGHWLDRMGADGEAVANDCREEIRTRWSAQRHAAAIAAVVSSRITVGGPA